MICNAFDVVEVPFPFSDLAKAKRRKALVLSSEAFNRSNGNSVLMMITSAEKSEWLFDTSIEDLESAGLRKACVARLKLFTLDNGLLAKKVGRFSQKDQRKITAVLKKALPIA
jgi:mRNA interferase MazF